MTFFVIGLPGSGRHDLARKLAASLELKYIDCEEYIGAICAEPVYALYNREPERFRSLEESCLADALAGDAVCVTCAFAPLDKGCAALLKRGKTIYVYKETERLWEDMPTGVFPSVDGRPFAEFEGIYLEIEEFYLKAAELMIYDDSFGPDAYRAAHTFVANALAK